MAFDVHTNLVLFTVALAPSPASSGTTLFLNDADATNFPDPAGGGNTAYNVTIFPAGANPVVSNAEIVKITAKSSANIDGLGHTRFTITRTQESTSARSILVGDQVMIAATKKSFTDIETQVNTNVTNIANNTSNISANTSNISTNTANIATNTSNITTLQGIARSDGWLSTSDTFVYVSASSFKITGVDRTLIYTKGTRVKFTNNSTTFYGVVISSAFSTDTTVTLAANTDFSINNSAITVPFYSYQVNPQGYPGWFAYTPTWGGFSANPTSVTSRFSITGRTCFVEISCGGNGTSNSTSTTVTLPANAATSLNISGFIGYNDNGATASTPGIIILAANSNIADLRKDLQAATWTASGSKAINLILTYEF